MPAFQSFCLSAKAHLIKPYPSRDFGPDPDAMNRVCKLACETITPTEQSARAFFEAEFQPFQLGDNQRSGFVTGYYEPDIEARRTPDAEFHIPIYARPTDLIALSDQESAQLPFIADRFAKGSIDGHLEPYFDRAAIENGALKGKGLEIAWVKDRIDLYFVHVQGAARLIYDDGTIERMTFDGKSGHGFTGAGSVLIARGALNPENVTMQTVRQWLAANPDKVDYVLQQNQSYIFFKRSENLLQSVSQNAGPIAAAKVPLTAGYSIAVDRLIHSFGMPFFIDVPKFKHRPGMAFQRLMIAQDTGSAIKGVARADLFMGSGFEAGEIAGTICDSAIFHILQPIKRS